MAQFYNSTPVKRLDDVSNEAVPAVPGRVDGRRYFSGRGVLYSLGVAVLAAAMGGCASTGNITLEGPYHRSPPRRAEAVRTGENQRILDSIIGAIISSHQLSNVDKICLLNVYEEYLVDIYKRPLKVYWGLTSGEKEKVDNFNSKELSLEEKNEITRLFPWIELGKPSLGDVLTILLYKTGPIHCLQTKKNNK